MAELIYQSFIDLPQWDKAKWLGVGFFAMPTLPPGLGLLFQNVEPGTKIFTDWKRQLGEVDEKEQIRISVLEGSIVGAAPGYNVRIGTNLDTLAPVAGAGVLTASRIKRMNPPPNSPNLANFKRLYQEHGTYALVQIVQDNNPMGFRPLFDTVIMKKQIFFRNVEDLGDNGLSVSRTH